MQKSLDWRGFSAILFLTKSSMGCPILTVGSISFSTKSGPEFNRAALNYSQRKVGGRLNTVTQSNGAGADLQQVV
jgi:hypothetical protein